MSRSKTPNPAWRHQYPSRKVWISGVLLTIFGLFILITSSLGFGDGTHAGAHTHRQLRPIYLASSYCVFGVYWITLYYWICVSKKDKNAGNMNSKITVYTYKPTNAVQSTDFSGDYAEVMRKVGRLGRPGAQEVEPQLDYEKPQDQNVATELVERYALWGDTKLVVYTVRIPP